MPVGKYLVPQLTLWSCGRRRCGPELPWNTCWAVGGKWSVPQRLLNILRRCGSTVSSTLVEKARVFLQYGFAYQQGCISVFIEPQLCLCLELLDFIISDNLWAWSDK
ncbi:unnamed protein product [Pipistrellus nathusii]|uniref:Uncharacterized protein n=1 Tax=Pipistrellus nathusii TaxID=59473 RepID=A0ABN9Z8D2_PIPNA